MSIEKTMLRVLEARAVEVRDVDAGEEPFLYSSGNWGPGYVTIKNLVGRKKLIKSLTRQLALIVAQEHPELHFVAGNATGGMTPGWILSEYLGQFLGRTVPFVYVRESRKKGGQKELITGIAHNPEVHPGDNVLVVEELVNFAQTTCNSAYILRDAGYTVTHAACILFYNNPEAVRALREANITMMYLFTLPQLLEAAEKYGVYSMEALRGYQEFLRDPLGWQQRRGLKPIEEGGTK